MEIYIIKNYCWYNEDTDQIQDDHRIPHLEAIGKYGAWKGGLLALRRFLRCNPFYHGDIYDPVP